MSELSDKLKAALDSKASVKRTVQLELKVGEIDTALAAILGTSESEE